MKDIDFNDKCVMITGAAGALGRVLACMFAERNANLVLTDLKHKYDKIDNLKHELEEKFNVKVYCLVLDNTNCKMIEDVILELEEKNIEIDILVNNAGKNYFCDAIDVDENSWDSIVDVNLKGTFFLTKEIAKYSIIRREGNVICISSQHGVVGNTERAPYCASKGAIINLVRALAIEWAKYNVRVNCVSPTFIKSEGNEVILNSHKFIRNYLNNIPLKRYATPRDVSESVLFLASTMASMITGHNLIVDGGWTAK